ncbi:MAG: hypothetical protein NZ922_06265, partial [Candidatus Methanomethyliaceae archaeon]|nr:hypothetical protein [Candidatus Methanomethyliaceae archaeon]
MEGKTYIYQHKHCIYCGRMIEVSTREYCLKCKPEHQKKISKLERERKIQRALSYYLFAMIALLIIIIAYY